MTASDAEEQVCRAVAQTLRADVDSAAGYLHGDEKYGVDDPRNPMIKAALALSRKLTRRADLLAYHRSNKETR